MRLFDEGFSPDEVFRHPRHQAAQKVLVERIEQLRACASLRDGYEVQQELLGDLLGVECDRNAFSKAVKRMRVGKPAQAGAPEPQSRLDPRRMETWKLEHDVCERVARQLRCVGDALAWRVFGFERKYILALCRNAPAGVMADKVGLAAERDRVEQAWKVDGRFAILHDLTNCLRIGDMTVFGHDGPETIEIKTSAGRRSPAQRRRIRAVQQALRDAAPLPGDDPKERLYDLDLPFRTHLELLALGTERAARDGIFAAKVAGNRVLVVSDFYGCGAQGWTDAECNERQARQYSAALRRAGIGPGREWNVCATSMDSVSRDPQRVPFAAYPLHPVFCARLIGDVAVFVVETRGPYLAETLCAAGIDAEWVHPPGSGELPVGEVVMHMYSETTVPLRGTEVMKLSRTLQMRRSELDRYLIELIEQGTWIEGMRHMLANRWTPGRPWPCYRDEWQVWV